MAKKKWLPKVGQVFDSRDFIEEKLLESGWEFEGHSTGLDQGEAISFDVGVTDKEETVWMMVDMEPYSGVKVTEIKRMKLPYERNDAVQKKG